MAPRKWGICYGRWWMLQWCFDGWISLGVHLDLKCRPSVKGAYGPYADFHLICVIVSFGNRPYLAGELEAKSSVAKSCQRA